MVTKQLCIDFITTDCRAKAVGATSSGDFSASASYRWRRRNCPSACRAGGILGFSDRLAVDF